MRAARATKLLCAALAVLAVGLPPSSSARARADVTLNLWPAGKGAIQASLENGTTFPLCDSEGAQQQQGTFCSLDVPVGTRVRLEARQTDPASPFLHWDRFDCEGTGPCTVEVSASGDVVVATFRAQTLQVIVDGEGAGKVTASAGGIDCPGTCEAAIPGDTEVVLTAEGAHTWGRGCEPDGGDPASARCTLRMSNTRTFVKVGFGVEPDPVLPFDVRVNVGVGKRGSGTGVVTGSGKDADKNDWQIDCGTKCSAQNLHIQTRITLQAQASPGSRFVRWLGVCSTEPTCTFFTGTQKIVGAVFEPEAAPPPPPPPPPPPFAAKVTKLTVVGAGATRAVVLRVSVDRPARATLRLVRGRTTLVTRRFTLSAGTASLRYPLPKRLRLGWYRLTGSFVSARGEVSPFDRAFRLRR